MGFGLSTTAVSPPQRSPHHSGVSPPQRGLPTTAGSPHHPAAGSFHQSGRNGQICPEFLLFLLHAKGPSAGSPHHSGVSPPERPEMVKFVPNFCYGAVDQEKAVFKRKRLLKSGKILREDPFCKGPQPPRRRSARKGRHRHGISLCMQLALRGF